MNKSRLNDRKTRKKNKKEKEARKNTDGDTVRLHEVSINSGWES